MASEINDVMFSNSANVSDKEQSVLKIIPLGGLEQIGMNITAFQRKCCGADYTNRAGDTV